MTTESHELFLYITNDRKSHNRHLSIARASDRYRSSKWVDTTQRAANMYSREFGRGAIYWPEMFTPKDVLSCALELEEYHARHLEEMKEGSS